MKHVGTPNVSRLKGAFMQVKSLPKLASETFCLVARRSEQIFQAAASGTRLICAGRRVGMRKSKNSRLIRDQRP